MATSRWFVLAGVFLLCRLTATIALADEARVGPDGLLRVTGTVLMPDGSPAAGATISSHTQWLELPKTARTDEAGRFELRDVFGNSARIHATSADGRHQMTRWVAAATVRATFAAPIELKLAPARTHEVTVTAEGTPAPGVQVAVMGHNFRADGVSGADGKAQLLVPADDTIRGLAGWHPELGCDGAWSHEGSQDMTRLALRAPSPYTIRAVDPEGKPAAGVELAVGISAGDSKWIPVRSIAASHVRTNAEGVASVPWAPKEVLQYVSADVVGSDWKQDEMDREQTAERRTTLRVRRMMPVQGRLVMPEGQSAEGILISGFGFGPAGTGDVPFVRARRDGSFTFPAPSDHGYVLGIMDSQWASDCWSGLILATDGAQPTEIKIDVYPATTLSVRVTRGDPPEPVADAWVEAGPRGRVEFVDVTGKKRRGNASVDGWLMTDAQGIARTGVGKGNIEVRLSNGKWDETQKMEVKSTEPVSVEFHRGWLGERRVTGQLTLDGKPYRPSATLLARAWAHRQDSSVPLEFTPVVNAEGEFQVTFDADNLSLLVVDGENYRSGFVSVGAKESRADIPMQPTAVYRGMLLDDNGKPLARRTVKIQAARTRVDVVAPQLPDQNGRFEFSAVPSNVPLQLAVDNGEETPRYILFGEERWFLPNEVRSDGVLKADRIEGGEVVIKAVKSSKPLADRIVGLCRNARLGRMHALVVLKGDDSAETAKVADTILAYDAIRAVLSYVTLEAQADEWRAQAKEVADLGWPLPAAGQIALIALDGQQARIASQVLEAADPVAARATAEALIKQHQPATHDAIGILSKARDEARASQRRVWVVLGGPRCGPCFRLARWMDDHHAVLEKDYVIAKVMEGLDQNADKVASELPQKDAGIPWHAITEADGAVLIHSEGPLGNIGMPSSVEGIRHLRAMLERTKKNLTAQEIDQLVASLTPAN